MSIYQGHARYCGAQPGDAGDVLACAALWKPWLEYLLYGDNGRPHPTLDPWGLKVFPVWFERPDQYLTRKQAVQLRERVETARRYDIRVARTMARWERKRSAVVDIPDRGPRQERIRVGIDPGGVVIAVLGRKPRHRAYAYLTPALARIVAAALIEAADMADAEGRPGRLLS